MCLVPLVAQKVIVTKTVTLARSQGVKFVDGVDSVRVARVNRRVQADLRKNDMVTAVNGAGVVGLLAAHVTRLLRECVPHLFPCLCSRACAVSVPCRCGLCSRLSSSSPVPFPQVRWSPHHHNPAARGPSHCRRCRRPEASVRTSSGAAARCVA